VCINNREVIAVALAPLTESASAPIFLYFAGNAESLSDNKKFICNPYCIFFKSLLTCIETVALNTPSLAKNEASESYKVERFLSVVWYPLSPFYITLSS
jgi:hypothetical protein